MAKKQTAYLSGGTMVRTGIVKYILLLFGGFLAVFFGIGLGLSLTDSPQPDLSGAVLSAVFLLLGLLLLWRGILAHRNMGLARRYQGIFLSSRDNVVKLEELTAHTGKDPEQVAKELEQLFVKGFFQGCSLRKSPLAVLLPDKPSAEAGIVTVTCPHCGGTSRIPAGSFGKCDYCGSTISG